MNESGFSNIILVLVAVALVGMAILLFVFNPPGLPSRDVAQTSSSAAPLPISSDKPGETSTISPTSRPSGSFTPPPQSKTPTPNPTGPASPSPSITVTSTPNPTASSIPTQTPTPTPTPTPPPPGTRYVYPIFSSVRITPDIVYSQPVVNVSGDTVVPQLDIYEPKEDVAINRLLIVLMHGGGFVNGTRKDQEMVDLAKEFAKRGYVVASIDYRLKPAAPDPDPLTPKEINDAQSDASAAVRWFRANATTYRIDTNKILAAGYSAGANLTHRLAYNYELVGTADDTNPSNPGYSSRTVVAVCVAPAGTKISTMQAGDPPLIQLWGELDGAYDNVGIPMKNLADSLGIINEIHTYPGAEHYKNLWTASNIADMAYKSGLFVYRYILN